MCTTVCNYTVITVQNANFILHSTVLTGGNHSSARQYYYVSKTVRFEITSNVWCYERYTMRWEKVINCAPKKGSAHIINIINHTCNS